MTVTESLQSAVTALQTTVEELSSRVDLVPDLIRKVVQKVLLDHPTGGSGTVTDADVLAAITAVNSTMKTINTNSSIVGTYFDNQLAHGDPEWPNTSDPTGPIIPLPR